MTSELSLAYAATVFEPNEVYNLPTSWQVQTGDLAAALWTVPGHERRRGHLACLEAALDAVRSSLPQHRAYLLAHTSVWLHNRLQRERYGSFEEAIAARRIRLHGVKPIADSVTEVDNQRHFFSLQALGERVELTGVLDLLAGDPRASIAVVPEWRFTELADLVNDGWGPPEQMMPPCREVLARVCRITGCSLWLYGSFDDPESGVLGFAQETVVSRLLSPKS